VNNQIYELLVNMDKKIDDIKNTMVTDTHCKERQANCKVGYSAKKSIAIYTGVTSILLGLAALFIKVF
jgi:hypothetical protein